MLRYRAFTISVLLGLLFTPLAGYSQQYDYLANDDLDFSSVQISAYTLGDILSDEWFVARIPNDTGETFVATEVQVLVAGPSSGDLMGYACSGQPLNDTVRIAVRVWTDNGEAVTPGSQIFTLGEGDDEEIEATVNAISRIPLGSDLVVDPGEWFRVGINFPSGANLCTGALMQDLTSRLGEVRNLMQATLAACDPLVWGDYCDLMELVTCVDEDFVWRNFNAPCESEPPGAGGSGDFAIRLARVHGGSSSDVGVSDVGTPDAGVDAGVDAPAALTINRVSPSMGPTNQDIEIDVFGTGFADGISVRIGSTDLTSLVVNLTGTQVTGNLAAGLPTGTYDVIASLGTDSYTYSSGYTVTDAEYAAPSISDLTPTSASAGESVEVTITGADFRDGATVLFGTASGRSVQVESDTTITVMSPSSLDGGVYDVTVENEDGQSDTLFEAFSVGTLAAAEDSSGCTCSVKAQPCSKWFLVALPIALVVVRRRRG